MEPSIDMVLHDRYLVTSSELQDLAPGSQWHGGASGVLEIRSEHNQFHAVRGERSFQSFQIEAEWGSRFWARLDRHSETTCARAVEDRHGPRVSRILENHRIARPHECFADDVQRLLATVGDEKIFVLGRDAIAAKMVEQRFLQRPISIRRSELQNLRGFAP